MKQRTLKQPVEFSGLGLHSGQSCSVVIAPAPDHAGLTINGLPVVVDNVSQTNRGTTLGRIAVVEHLLAALNGLGVDNAVITVTGLEIPGLDGSATPFVQAILQSGLVEQKAEKQYFSLAAPVKVEDGNAALEARPNNGFKVEFVVNFPVVGRQRFVFDSQKSSFAEEIAPARTVGWLAEYESLKKQGLALGASLDNALVIGSAGYLNQPRFSNEIVRHKILDLIGDLALLGQPLKAELKARLSGHKLNIALVKKILRSSS